MKFFEVEAKTNAINYSLVLVGLKKTSNRYTVE
jgi:hypothetical protein